MRKILISLIMVSFPILTQCQAGSSYNISVDIDGLRDSSIFLAYHFGDKQYLMDTVRLDAGGRGVFSGREKLPQGIYMIVLPGKKYFEILVSDDQQFSLSCNYNDYYNTLKFSGSDDNSYFIEYQRKWGSMQQQASALSRRYQNNKQNSDSAVILAAKQKDMESAMKSYLKKVIADNSNSILGALVKSMLPLEIPEFEVPMAVKNRDSILWVKRYNYNKDHFFDNIDLSDERLLRTPIVHARLETYFTNVLIQHPDSIIKAIDRLNDRFVSNPKVFQFIAVFLFNRFRESQIMGHDAVLLKIADDYYLSGKADWVSKEFLTDLSRQSELLRNNLMGMKAQNLVMDSYKGIFVSLYDIEKEFTILYFWEPDCGHCVEATPKLKAYYEKARNEGVEIFAVCTTSQKEEWSKYIEENGLNWINGWDPDRKTRFDYYYNVQSTPMVYILDKGKKIIAKKLSIEDIPSFIDNYRKYNM